MWLAKIEAMNLAHSELMMLNDLESTTAVMLMYCYRFAMSLTLNGSSNSRPCSNGEHQNQSVLGVHEQIDPAANQAMMETLAVLGHLSNVAHCRQLTEL